jgi:hypothetical protein
MSYDQGKERTECMTMRGPIRFIDELPKGRLDLVVKTDLREWLLAQAN